MGGDGGPDHVVAVVVVGELQLFDAAQRADGLACLLGVARSPGQGVAAVVDEGLEREVQASQIGCFALEVLEHVAWTEAVEREFCRSRDAGAAVPDDRGDDLMFFVIVRCCDLGDPVQ